MRPLLADDPAHVGNHILLGRLGRGAMGTVYLARSRGGRAVAVKVVGAGLAADPAFRERFRREVQSARAVGGFWTASVVDADPEADRPWLATEYVPGPTLHEAVTAGGPFSEHAVRQLGAGLAEALCAIHSVGVVHRDLKPGNVLIGADGPRVIDFGISRVAEQSSLTATGMFLGTPGFFSPEQVDGHDIGPASDVFSLGALLVFAATGAGPFGDGPTAAMIYRVVHAEPDLGRVPPGLRDLVGGCLAKDPAHRPTPDTLLGRIGPTHGASATPKDWLPAQVTQLIDARVKAATRMLTHAEEPPGKPVTQVLDPPPYEPEPEPEPHVGVRTWRDALMILQRPAPRALLSWLLTALVLIGLDNALRPVTASALATLLLVMYFMVRSKRFRSYVTRRRLLLALGIPALPALSWVDVVAPALGGYKGIAFTLCYLAHSTGVLTFVNASMRTAAGHDQDGDNAGDKVGPAA